MLEVTRDDDCFKVAVGEGRSDLGRQNKPVLTISALVACREVG